MLKEIKDIVHVKKDFLPCNNGVDKCLQRERTVSFATFVSLPVIEEETESGVKFAECCYLSYVLADNSGVDYKNDYSGFFYSRQLETETCEFFLVSEIDGNEIRITNNDYGLFNDFNSYESNSNLTTFVVEWSKVLSSLGEGAYKVVQKIEIAGVQYNNISETFNLRTYTTELANHTIRLDVEMNGLLEEKNANFKGTKFKSALRLEGFFGRREPKFEQDNIVFTDKRIVPISIKQKNEYQVQTGLLPICITNQIWDFMLFAEKIKINDYNLNNHSYDFKNKEVKFENNKGTKYYSNNRNAILNLTFSDRYVNKNNFSY